MDRLSSTMISVIVIEPRMIRQKIVAGLLGTSLIVLYLPFDFELLGNDKWVVILGMYSLLTAVVVLSDLAVTHLFKKPDGLHHGFDHCLKRHLIFDVINVLALTVALTLYIDWFATKEMPKSHLSLQLVAQVFVICLVTTVIVHVVRRLQSRKKLLAMKLEEAAKTNEMLKKKCAESNEMLREMMDEMEKAKTQWGRHFDGNKLPPVENIILHLQGTTKESIEISLFDFLFAESDGNYTVVHFMDNGKLSKFSLRSTIKDIENNVKHCPYIVRCHRAFIVNMLMARHIDNRNRGCNLTLSHYDKPIPVSGTYHEAVKELALFS